MTKNTRKNYPEELKAVPPQTIWAKPAEEYNIILMITPKPLGNMSYGLVSRKGKFISQCASGVFHLGIDLRWDNLDIIVTCLI